MGHIFLSHDTDDDAVARALQRALGDHGLDVWLDSRELRGGDLLSAKIRTAIESADAFMVLVSPGSLQSDWVGEELDHAVKVLKERHETQAAAGTNGADAQPSKEYRIVPLSLDGTRLGVLKKYFGDSPLYVSVSSAAGGVEALEYLVEAQQRFDAVAKVRSDRSAALMAAVCFVDQGNCLRDLGRLDEAAAAYEESIGRADQLRDEREVAIGKLQLASVRRRQGRYKEAIDVGTVARLLFAQLGDPRTVAVAWHQIGSAHREAGQPDEAEDAYRQSLAINVQLVNVYGQGHTLNSLGSLYNQLGRHEEAASQHRSALDCSVMLGDKMGEGVRRGNLAETLFRLARYNEARQEVQRSIKCKEPFGHAAQPWVTWSLLALIEVAAINAGAAAQAYARARDCYLAYRRDGGENHYTDGRIALVVTNQLLAGDVTGAMDTLATLDLQLANLSLLDALRHRSFVVALRAIITGSRDRSLADAPELDYTMAAELLLLIDALEAVAPGDSKG